MITIYVSLWNPTHYRHTCMDTFCYRTNPKTMNNKINVFVSYTLRDGTVSKELLLLIRNHLSGICNPFVHALLDQSTANQQFNVIKALMGSHLVILLESPSVYDSPWVRLELLLSRLRFLPVVRLNVADLNNTDWRIGAEVKDQII
jgi:hypothetical protein